MSIIFKKRNEKLSIKHGLLFSPYCYYKIELHIFLLDGHFKYNSTRITMYLCYWWVISK